MRFALFCDGAYGPTAVAMAPTHVLKTTIEAKVVLVIAIALVWRRTPIVAVLSGVVER